MNIYEEKLKKYIEDEGIQAQQLIFKQSCHSVKEAAEAANASPEDLVKNICMIDQDNRLIVAIVKGDDRVSTSKTGKALSIETPRIAVPDEILRLTGYLCGGVPSFGYDATFIIDPRVMERETILTGGGSPNALLRISTEELQRVNHAQILRIRK